MVKAIMHGCNGKMGQVISGLVKEDDVIEIVAGIDKFLHSTKGTDGYSSQSLFSII